MKRAREKFEYRLLQPSKDIKDFVEYIKYERNLIALTNKRTKERKPAGTNNVCSLISNHMKQLYDQALSRFSHNLRFWDEYIKFLQQFKYNQDISATFDRMLQVYEYMKSVSMSMSVRWTIISQFRNQTMCLSNF